GLAGPLQQLRGAGVGFSVLDDTTNFFRVMLGQNVPLFTYTLPPVGWTHSDDQLLVVVPVVGPICFDARMVYTVGIHSSGVIGFDTWGLLAGDPVRGFFVQNLGLDVDASFGLYGGVGVTDVVEAGLTATVGVHLHAYLAGPSGTTVYGDQLASGAARVA